MEDEKYGVSDENGEVEYLVSSITIDPPEDLEGFTTLTAKSVGVKWDNPKEEGIPRWIIWLLAALATFLAFSYLAKLFFSWLNWP